MKEQFCDIIFIFTSVILFSAISYFAGAFIFITIPKEIIEPFIITYPIFSYFVKFFIGSIFCLILYVFQNTNN